MKSRPSNKQALKSKIVIYTSLMRQMLEHFNLRKKSTNKTCVASNPNISEAFFLEYRKAAKRSDGSALVKRAEEQSAVMPWESLCICVLHVSVTCDVLTAYWSLVRLRGTRTNAC